PGHARIEPVLEPGAFLPRRQKENSEPQFAENDGVDRDLALVLSQPFDGLGVGRRPRRLAENVGVDKVSHSVSVDPDSIGTKKPFSGQPRSQSSAPSLGAGERRLSRYSPGRTIWPFEETVVFISCKISSYTITSSRLLSPPRRGLRSAISFLSTR